MKGRRSYMAFTYSFDVNTAVNRGFYCQVRLSSGDIDFVLKEEALLDTGATTCHISFPLWCNLGFHELCFSEKRDLLRKIGIFEPDGITFNTLPLKAHTTRLGNGVTTDTYEFRASELCLGDSDILEGKSFLSKPVTLKNITIRIIDSPEYELIIGLNVLRYMTIRYKPSIEKSICHLLLDNNGRQLLENDRTTRNINNMSGMFDYISDTAYISRCTVKE